MLHNQFPFFKNNSNIYLDSAASCQKPQTVIDAITDFYSSEYSSNHGVHNLANNLNEKIESCRELIARFINAKSSKEIVFTSGATESFNLIAQSIKVPKNKTNILICIAEHHSNLLPWQILATENNLEIRYFRLTKTGEIDLGDFESKIDSDTFLVAASHCSNVLGIINDVQTICEIGSKYGAISVVDATQSIVHTDVDVQGINCDFLAFSGHKIYGPTGIGVLYGKSEQLEKLNNYKVGGEMVELVTREKNYYKETPYRFEAGTINLAGIIGLKAAIEWFISNKQEIFDTEKELYKYCLEKLLVVENIEMLGYPLSKGSEAKTQGDSKNHRHPELISVSPTTEDSYGVKTTPTATLSPLHEGYSTNTNVIMNEPKIEIGMSSQREVAASLTEGVNPTQRLPTENKLQPKQATIFSFTIQGINSYDLAEYLNLKNISIRVGQHCTGLLHEHLELDSTLRISLACYNTREDIDKFVEEIKNGIRILKF